MNLIDMFGMKGKKAIVTGGSRGLGYAMAEGLHEAGAEIVLIASNEEKLKRAAEKLGKEGAKVYYAAADLGQTHMLDRTYEKALGCLGGHLDILINGAGVQYRCKAEDFPADRWQSVINVNLNAVFTLCQLAGRTMLAQGSGKIINIASMTSFFGSEMVPAYSASKGGVMQLTKALSNEWASRGVNVNAIAPGYMITELTGDMKAKNPGQYEEITNRIPAHRWGQPEDLMGAVLFLSSRASDYVSGTILPVDGGYLGK